MFTVLDRFDLALAHAHHRQRRPEARNRLDIPAAFPEYNAGVIMYRKTPEVVRMLEEWWRRFQQAAETISHDQVTLREVIWLSDLRVATLPPEYNVRYVKYHLLWSRSEAVTRIFHLKALHKGWLGWSLRGPRRVLRRARRQTRGVRGAPKLAPGHLVVNTTQGVLYVAAGEVYIPRPSGRR